MLTPCSTVPVASAAGYFSQTLVKHPISLLKPYLSPEETGDVARVGPESKFAVIQLSGTQFKVCVDDVVATNLIRGYDIGESFEVKDVLLVGSLDSTTVGRPHVRSASVVLEVEEHTKDEKVVVFKKKRRKNYKRTTGFRRDVTVLRVTAINAEE